MTLKRITFMQKLLTFMGLEGRLHLEWISSAEAQKFVRVVTDFTETIRRLGPSPLQPARNRQPANVMISPPGMARGLSDAETTLSARSA
jgi:F420-non-reducing hydrogenase iron-sulfur subunit